MNKLQQALAASTPAAKHQSELIKKELRRMSQDVVAVYNPTDEDYPLKWDGFYHVVPNKNKNNGYGKGVLHVSRYLGMKYIEEMRTKLLNQETDKLVAKENDRRVKAGLQPMTKYMGGADSELVYAQRVTGIGKPERELEVNKLLYKGLIQEFGSEVIASSEPQKEPESPLITNTMSFMMDFDTVIMETPLETNPETVSVTSSETSESAVSQLIDSNE